MWDRRGAGPIHPGVEAVFADLDRNDAPGAAVGVLLNGEVVHRAGYGIADMDHGIPITPGLSSISHPSPNSSGRWRLYCSKARD